MAIKMLCIPIVSWGCRFSGFLAPSAQRTASCPRHGPVYCSAIGDIAGHDVQVGGAELQPRRIAHKPGHDMAPRKPLLDEFSSGCARGAENHDAYLHSAGTLDAHHTPLAPLKSRDIIQRKSIELAMCGPLRNHSIATSRRNSGSEKPLRSSSR